MSSSTIKNPLAYLKPSNWLKAAVVLSGASAVSARYLAPAPGPNAFSQGPVANVPTADALQSPTLGQSTDPRLVRYCQSDLDDAAASSWADLCDNPPSRNTFGLSKQCVVGGYALGETPATEPEDLKTVCNALKKNKATGCQTTIKPCLILGLNP